MSNDLTTETVAALVALAASTRSRGGLGKVVELVASIDPDEFAAGVTQPELAARAGVTDRSVRRIFRQLEELGVLHRIELPRRCLGYRVDAARLEIVRRALP